MKHSITALLILCASCQVLSAQLPDAPKPTVDRTEWALLAADVASRTLDVYSTRKMLLNGNHEKFLPDFISHSTPAMAAVSGGAVALDFWYARRLERHGHRTMAHLLTTVDVGQDAPWAIHNLFLGKRNQVITPIHKGRF